MVLHALQRLGMGILGLIAMGICLVLGQIFSAGISGVVRDPSGAVIPEAMVTLQNTETGLRRTTET
jgi:hypothetical protein